jgi:hypothetical protein
MMTHCRHYKCHKCYILVKNVTSVVKIILSSRLCRFSNEIIRTLENTLRDWFKKEKLFDEEYKAFSLKKTT